MILEVTTAINCPHRCPYCPQGAMVKAYQGPRLMDPKTFIHAIEHCADGCSVSFAGFADPYLNRQTSRMIGVADSRFHPVQVYTTGVFMDDADVEMLIRVQPFNVVIHLPDSGGQMRAEVTPAHAERMARLQDRLNNFACMCYGDPHPLLAGIRRNYQQHPLISRAGNVFASPVHWPTQALRCKPGPDLDHPVMLPDGRVVLCCMDYGLKHVIGNLAEQDWGEIFTGAALNRVRSLMQSNGGDCLCRHCELARCAD